jgi:hypothetical protein
MHRKVHSLLNSEARGTDTPRFAKVSVSAYIETHSFASVRRLVGPKRTRSAEILSEPKSPFL